MSIRQVTGNIADSEAQIICNTINCVGKMGKGVALAIKERFPEIMPAYEKACQERRVKPGSVMISATNDGRKIINLATKDHYRDPSRYEWAGASLFYMNYWLEKKGIEPCMIAIPLPGAGNGNLDPGRSGRMVATWLAPIISKGFSVELYGAPPQIDPDPVFYAGVGARDTPGDVLEVMSEFGSLAAAERWSLRSGGARGADKAFHTGALEAGAKSEIFLAEPKGLGGDFLFRTKDVHYHIMRTFHPTPKNLSKIGIELMARNGCQVLGDDFRDPSRLVVCWTVGGELKGGTAQAIKLATAAGIPVLNLGRPELKGITAGDALDLAKEMVASRNRMLEPGLAVGFPSQLVSLGQ